MQMQNYNKYTRNQNNYTDKQQITGNFVKREGKSQKDFDIFNTRPLFP